MMILFSVIVPVYNVGTYLPRCLDSILNQTFKSFELILVDDGSTDNSASVCDYYAENDSRIKVIHKKNEGLVEARKSGLKLATGEYIINIDSDDYIDINLFEKIKLIVKKYNPDIISFNYQEVNESNQILRTVSTNIIEGLYCGEKLDSIRHKYMYDKSQKHFNTGCLAYTLWTKVIKYNLITKFQYKVPSELRNGEDLAVVTPCICQANSLYIMNYIGYFYLQRGSSIVHTFRADDFQRIVILEEFLRNNSLKIPKENIDNYCFRMVCSQFSKAVKVLSYIDFLNYVKECINNVKIKKIIVEFNSRNLSLKGRIIAKCIQHNLWSIFWIIYKKRK